MSKEEQKAASGRITAKEPLAGEESATYRLLTRRPDDYPRPGDTRTCGVCGAKFGSTTIPKGEILVSALEKFTDHLAGHNPTADKWAEAHSRIQVGRTT